MLLKKVLLVGITFFISNVQAAEPLLISPFAKEIKEISKDCISEIVKEVRAYRDRHDFQSRYQSDFGWQAIDGRFYFPKAYAITVRGVIYSGGDIVFTIKKAFGNSLHKLDLEDWRGDLDTVQPGCRVSNIRYTGKSELYINN